MFRAILDLTDVDLFDNQIPMTKPSTGLAYLLNESGKNTRKAIEFAQSPEFQRSVWISISASDLNDERDLKFLLQAPAAAILLRGCKGPADVEKACVLLTILEIEQGQISPKTKIIASIADTASAVQSLSKWTERPDRLSALYFDPHELALSLGLATPFARTGQRLPLLETSAHLSLFTAKALHCPLYDATIWDLETNLSEQYFLARQMGFAGAVARNPNQVDLINAIFA